MVPTQYRNNPPISVIHKRYPSKIPTSLLLDRSEAIPSDPFYCSLLYRSAILSRIDQDVTLISFQPEQLFNSYEAQPRQENQRREILTSILTDSITSRNTSFLRYFRPSDLHETAFVTAIGGRGAISSVYRSCVIYLKQYIKNASPKFASIFVLVSKISRGKQRACVKLASARLTEWPC